MSYFVTGATGFIGRHLVERLLEREGDIYVLVREGSRGEARRAACERWGAADRIKPGHGRPRRAAARRLRDGPQALAGRRPLLPPRRDLRHDRATRTRNALLNVGGTQNAIDLANALGAGRFHHVSSIAVAGELRGPLHRGHVRRGPELPHALPPHQVRVREARARARRRCRGASTARRVVVGNSETGEMDKIDGPYYFFKAIQKLRHALPEWFPLVGLEVGRTNIVPVDYVAAAMDHIAHQDGLDGQAVPPRRPEAARAPATSLNTFANAGARPAAR